MAFGFRSNTQPVRTNPKWVLLFKLAQQFQTRSDNAPKVQNTSRQLINKCLKSLNGQ